MYHGTDFVGRMTMPLVAIGEEFTAGFGVDPQLQVQRQMLDKTRTMQGGNQVLKYEYRILVSSYKKRDGQAAGVGPPAARRDRDDGRHLVKTTPEVSKDALYLRESGRATCCAGTWRWSRTMNGEKAWPINYEFRLELDKIKVIQQRRLSR